MTEPGMTTYQDAGVDIDASDEFLRALAPRIARTHSDRVVRGVGHFGGFYRLTDNLTLVASIDGVGTKLKLASLAGDHSGVGYDIVNHCINDIAACGARPICFLDYFATGHLDLDTARSVIGGIADACAENGVALIGGETAEMPGIYQGDDYDVAGVIIGLVESNRIIDGTSIRAGDALIGILSDGFHTNGYSLIRAALGLNDDEGNARERLREPLPWSNSQSVAQALLTPHRSYLAVVSAAMELDGTTGMAHITGGGIAGNLGRIIPSDLTAVVDSGAWEVPRLMMYVAERGHVATEECFRVFNMGIGFIIVCRPDEAERLLQSVDDSVIIGEVAPATTDERVQII